MYTSHLIQRSLKYQLVATFETRVSLASFPGPSRPCMQLLSAGWGLGNEAINVLTLEGVLNLECH